MFLKKTGHAWGGIDILELSQNAKYQFMLIMILMAVACLLTYYFRNILGIGTVFTHFFYIPIVLACIWWKRKGLVVTLFLTCILLFSHKLFNHYVLTLNDYLRAFMLLIISFVIVGLSEKLSLVQVALQTSEKIYQKIFETTGTAMIIIEDDTTILLANAEFETLTGFSSKDVENRKSWTEFVAQEDRPALDAYHRMRSMDSKSAPQNYEFRIIDRRGATRDVFMTVDMIPGTKQSVASLCDITELKFALQKQKTLQHRLSDALSKVLSGFIPICANCKNIRDENNNWIQVESYIGDRTDAKFSHGICQECIKKLYPKLINSNAAKQAVSRA